jgi:hypothetical protein
MPNSPNKKQPIYIVESPESVRRVTAEGGHSLLGGVAVKSVEAPSDHAVAPTLSDIHNHSLIFRSTLARGGKDVIVNVGLDNRDLVGLRPAKTFIDLAAHAVLVPIAVLGYAGLACGRFHFRDINKPW